MTDLAILEKNLGLVFKNKEILKHALIHRSYLNEAKEKSQVSNERLEFLGDSVLSLITSTYLYHQFPNAAEGVLTNYRSSLVKTETLASIARELDLGNFLLLSKGEEDSGGRNNQGLLANGLEAIIGAIFLDLGIEKTTNFVSEKIFPLLPSIIENKQYRDYKSLLQEYLQGKRKMSPRYKVLKTTGPDHERIFTISVSGRGEELGTGTGRSKQIAQQEAAKAALEKLAVLK